MADKDVTLSIDGREVVVPAGTLVIRAAERLGVFVPRFCDHPLLDPLGACRQCLVEIEGQRKPLTACTTPVADGMVVRTQFSSEGARDAQEGVLELLLINHPLDCPQCDKGGECPLQDQALAYGPGASRFVDPKRRYPKPIPISPLVKLDRERCVLCARCTRFAAEISGDPFIELFERGALEQVAIYSDEPYESHFSGNVVQICPVGALTASTFRFRARPFDISGAAGVCNRCSSGCSIVAQERRGELVRVLSGVDPDVNEEWTCDKGRFAYGYVHHPERVTEPLVRKDGQFVAVSWAEAVARVAEGLGAARERGAGVLAGGVLATEDAYSLSRFARVVLGTNDVDARMRPGSDEEDAVLAAVAAARGATYADVEGARAVLVVGADLREESPILFLRVRKAWRKRGTRVHEVGPRRTALGRAAGAAWTPCAPGEEGAALAAVLGILEAVGGGAPPGAAALAEALVEARGTLVVVCGERAAASPGALSAAWNIALALEGRFAWVPRRGGARGALWAGLHPALLPGGREVADAAARAEVAAVWGAPPPEAPGRDAVAMLEGAHNLGALYLVGADPVADFADPDLGERGLDGSPFVVAHDLFLTASARRADVVLPAAASFERAGTWTDWEGRARPNRPAIPARGLARADFEILGMVAEASSVRFPTTLEALHREMRALERPPREPHAIETRAGAPAVAGDGLRLTTAPLLLDDGTMLIGSDVLRDAAPETRAWLNPADAGRLGIADGDRVTVRSPGAHETVLPALVTDDVAPGVVFVPARTGRALRNEGAAVSVGRAGGA